MRRKIRRGPQLRSAGAPPARLEPAAGPARSGRAPTIPALGRDPLRAKGKFGAPAQPRKSWRPVCRRDSPLTGLRRADPPSPHGGQPSWPVRWALPRSGPGAGSPPARLHGPVGRGAEVQHPRAQHPNVMQRALPGRHNNPGVVCECLVEGGREVPRRSVAQRRSVLRRCGLRFVLRLAAMRLAASCGDAACGRLAAQRDRRRGVASAGTATAPFAVPRDWRQAGKLQPLRSGDRPPARRSTLQNH